ncbi:hypothetical protein ACFC8N_31840 [Streptomyces sp. NPDC055966]|uniref:hypothetical protein n=2 Tax=unclassified Streptomyces TaxID=2593676 RepID=UPI0035D91157
MPLTHLLEVSAVTLDGGTGPELRVTRTFPRRLLTRHQVGEPADAWFAALRDLTEPADDRPLFRQRTHQRVISTTKLRNEWGLLACSRGEP